MCIVFFIYLKGTGLKEKHTIVQFINYVLILTLAIGTGTCQVSTARGLCIPRPHHKTFQLSACQIQSSSLYTIGTPAFLQYTKFKKHKKLYKLYKNSDMFILFYITKTQSYI